jgi:hypothetical protein
MDKSRGKKFQGFKDTAVPLPKYHAMKAYPLLNLALCHEDVWGVEV